MGPPPGHRLPRDPDRRNRRDRNRLGDVPGHRRRQPGDPAAPVIIWGYLGIIILGLYLAITLATDAAEPETRETPHRHGAAVSPP